MLESHEIMKRLKEHLNSALEVYSCDWLAIAVQGSQNYGIADDKSDVDSKLLVIPSFRDIVFNKSPISTTYIMPDETQEHVDIKDVREYFKIFRKSNINFVEILFTDYYLVNPKYAEFWYRLQSKAEEIAHINPYAAVSCMKGMSLEKRKALCHEYPSRMPWIEKYGYDPKQLSHLCRIEFFLAEYINETPYKDCIYPRNEEFRNYLLRVKRNGDNKTKEEAIALADDVVATISDIADCVRGKTGNSSIVFENKENKDASDILDDILYNIIKRAMRKELILNEW